jgi:hypothetical protein
MISKYFRQKNRQFLTILHQKLIAHFLSKILKIAIIIVAIIDL